MKNTVVPINHTVDGVIGHLK